jgi:hypothetical protein
VWPGHWTTFAPLGGNDAADERRFATAARVSETNLALYRTFAQPMVRALVNPAMAEGMLRLHPLRLQYELFSNENLMMAPVATLAEQVRKDRRPVATDNPFLAMQDTVSDQIVHVLDAWRDMSEALAERTFLLVYGLPTLQAAVGIDPSSTRSLRQAAKSPLHQELLQRRIAELKSRMPVGGLREAVARRLRQAHGDMPLAEFKALVREQFNMLLVDQTRALAAILTLLPPDAETRIKAFDLIKQVMGARGEISAEDRTRLGEVARLFGVDDEGGVESGRVRPIGKERQARAS